MSRVYLAGAGPGDPELLTLKTLRVLRSADVVLHDSLVPPEILVEARGELVDVGKRCGRHSKTQDQICALLVRYAQQDGIVLRLKGGDPMMFGRAAEEMLALDAHGISYEILPGITAASAAAASLKRSLTFRQVSRSVHFITGHAAEGGLPPHDFRALAQAGGTLAIYMGGQTFGGFAAHLIEAGLAPKLPALAIENVSRPDERVFTGTLASLPLLLARAEPKGPVLILVGEAMSDDAPVSGFAFAQVS
jgi:uroporphyrin-III C-methyltransferase